MITSVIHTLWQNTIRNGRCFLMDASEEKVRRSKLIIQFFYLFTLLTAFQTFSSFYQFPEWDTLLASQHLFKPVWSVQWISAEYWEVSVRFILLFYFFSSLLGLLFWQRSRFIRAAVFMGLFLYLSLISSFGKIDHYMHIMVLAAFLLIMIPNKSASNYNGASLLQVVFGIQTLILLTYFISGFFKLYGIADQELSGSISALSADSLARNISKTFAATNTNTFFGGFILRHPSPWFSLLLLLGYLVEFSSIYVIFKPQWHRTWGVVLLLLHAVILWSVGPDFTIQASVVGIFLVFSPFTHAETEIVPKISAFRKGFGQPFAKPKKHQQLVVYFDESCSLSQRYVAFLSSCNPQNSIRFCERSSQAFHAFTIRYPHLEEIKSIIVVEQPGAGEEVIRMKTDAMCWLLAQTKPALRWFCYVQASAPFVWDSLYDFFANSTITRRGPRQSARNGSSHP